MLKYEFWSKKWHIIFHEIFYQTDQVYSQSQSLSVSEAQINTKLAAGTSTGLGISWIEPVQHDRDEENMRNNAL